jgi:hypothetical protein
MEQKQTESKADYDNYTSKSKGFFSYVFNTDKTIQTDMINLTQYIVLAFFFILSLITLMKNYFPIIDEEYSTIEIIIFIILYIFILFYGLYFINRIICYIPTYTGQQYAHCSSVTFLFPLVLSILTSMASFNPQINNGISIIMERIHSFWESRNATSGEKKKKKKTTTNSNNSQQQSLETQQIAPTLYTGQSTPINQLPVISSHQPQQQQQQQSSEEPPVYNEPVAANAGGSAFGGAFGDTW